MDVFYSFVTPYIYIYIYMYFQLIYEFCNIVKQERHQLYKKWQKWLPKMAVTVRDNITMTSLKSLHPCITGHEDFDEPDGT